MNEAHEKELKRLVNQVQERDKLIAEMQMQTDQLRQKNDNDLELEKFKMQMQLKERYYKMVYASRCIVM
jgi:hypothetical protein